MLKSKEMQLNISADLSLNLNAIDSQTNKGDYSSKKQTSRSSMNVAITTKEPEIDN